MRLLSLATCLLALGLTGCGAGVAPEPGPEGEAAAAAPASIRLTKAEAKATARAMLPRASDLRSWTKVPFRAETDEARAAECAGWGDAARFRPLADEPSPIFVSKDDAAFVVAGAAIFPTRKKARRAFAALARDVGGERLRSCFIDEMRAAAEAQGGTLAPPRVRPLRYRVAARSAGFRAALRLQVEGRACPGYMSVAFMQTRQAIAVLVTFSLGERFDRETEVRLARLTADRMELAQAAHDPQV